MALNQEQVDAVIVNMMSMGFELSECQEAIQFGKTTVESAVEWLVSGKPGLRETPGTGVAQTRPSLTLRPATSTFDTNQQFVKLKPVQQDVTTDKSNQSQSSTDPSNQSDKTSEMDVSQSEESVVSRMHMSDAQRKYKENFEHKTREDAKKQAKLEKIKQKEAHARVLKEIAEDREKKRLLAQPASRKADASQVFSDTNAAKEQKMDTSEAKPAPKQPTTCLLQIRLPDGRSLRHSFNCDASLHDVWEFTRHHHRPMQGFMFIQPFPRREFHEYELPRSLADLDLTPTGSLVLQKVPETKDTGPMETSADTEESEEVPTAPTPPPASHVHTPAHHRWGQGQALDDENVQGNDQQQQVEEENDDDGDEDEDHEMLAPGHMGGPGHNMGGGGHHMGGGGHYMGGGGGHHMGGGGGHHMGGGGGHHMGGGGGHHMGGAGMPPMGHPNDIFGMQGGGGHGGAAFGGVGQRLVPEGHPEHDEGYQHRSVRDLAFERAQARLAQPAINDANPAPCVSPPASTSQVTSLTLHCLRQVAQRLNDPRHQLLSLAGIPEDVAQVILNHLIKEKQLKPKTLNAFLPCYLRKLILDCYPYATNEILHAIRLHVNLSHLSVSSCPLITDAGLSCLTTLKKLRRLNLSCCRQLSNKCVSMLTSLHNLVSLNLEDTGVSDLGVIEFLASQPQNLLHLNLNKTSVTQAIIPHIHACARQLKSLAVEDTKVVSLTGIQTLDQLETLNVARTGIVTESLLCLVQMPALTSLNIANTEHLHGDTALQHLQGLNLHALTLPSRHTTTNAGIQCLAGFPLSVLDLTNYIFVSDEAMEHIGQIKTLRRLLLGNTKLTDAGMMFLEGLKQLEVLDIDRTLVTDQGATVIKAFSNLTELSMASTGITTKLLLSGHMNSCVHLKKLNLSKTLVSSKGVLNLALPYLQLMNLDGTKVKPDLTVSMVTGCPRLSQMTMRNLEPFTRDDEIEEAEMKMDI